MTPWVNDAKTMPRGPGHETQDLPEDISQIPRSCEPSLPILDDNMIFNLNFERLTRTVRLPSADNSTFAPSSKTPSYLGYKFFKADPIPGEEATWTKVERMEMEASQSELSKKVQKRANKVSAAQQYQMLSDILKAHVNQLIYEQRLVYPHGDWSCVYAKERQKASKVRNACRDDYEVVSMQVILLQRPLQTKLYPRTPMGELVDLRAPSRFGAGLNHPRRVNSENSQNGRQGSNHLPQLHAGFKQPPSPPYVSGQTRQGRASGAAVELEGAAATHADFATRPSTSDGVSRGYNPDGSGSFKLAAVEELRGIKRPRPDQRDLEADEGSETIESDAQSDSGSFTPRTNSPSESSTTGGASPSIRCTCQDHCSSPASFTSFDDLDEQTPYAPGRFQHQDDTAFSEVELKNARCASPCISVDTVQPRSVPPTKRPRLSALHKLQNAELENKLYIQSLNEEELRNRLLDCEARIDQWEKTFHRQTQMLWTRVVQRSHHAY